MSDTVMVSVVGGVVAIVLGLLQAFTAVKLAATQVLLKSVETKVDGRLSELLTLTRESSKAEGVKEEKERE